MSHVIEHSLPLENLLFRLEQAGLRISPGDRLRAYRVLAGPGKEYLREPEKLKYLLAPILCRSGAEQSQFYQIFDAYLVELRAEDWLVVPADNAPSRWWIWPLAALALATVLYLIWLLLQPAPVPPEADFSGPTSATEGDVVRFQNSSRFSRDSSTYAITWEYRDRLTGKAEFVDSQSYHWEFTVPKLPDTSYRKEIVLHILDPEDNTEYVARQPFEVQCGYRPNVVGIATNLPPDGVLANSGFVELEPVWQSDQISDQAENPWTYRWDMGDSTIYRDPTVRRHSYETPGRYLVQLTVQDTAAGAFCGKTVNLEITVKENEQDTLVILPPMSYARLPVQPVAGWRSWVWQIPYLMALLLVGLWWRWWNARRLPPSATATPPTDRPKIQVSDKAPYYVPWQDQRHYLPMAAAHFRLADAMRQRQAGFRQHIDVERTVGATIQRGGFPDVRFGQSTRPGEYLLLIDEEGEHSHLGRLFRHLATQLRGQDVFAEVFYYRKQLNRFWNAEHPEGLSLGQLAFHHTKHRLLLFGDAHELLDPGATAVPRLRPESLSDLRAWRERLILTPQPPVSWTFREKLLAKHFAVFPADLRGLSDAAQWLETNAEDPSERFDSWKERQTQLRREADVEYRRWRRWRDHAAYLEEYPALRTWFLALAVYPHANWELTIAIGRALRDYGVTVDYDSLLYLARIPSLNEGRFEPRLRREMLRELDPQVETIARRVVREELTAVRELAREGHAGLELESELAMQSFALDPSDPTARETIHYLLDAGLLTPRQRNDLERSVTAHSATETSSVSSFLKTAVQIDPDPAAVDLEAYFAVGEDPPQQQPPFFSVRFWTALAASLLVLALFLTLQRMDRTVALQERLFTPQPTADTPPASRDRPEPRRNWLAEEIYLDAAQDEHDAALWALADGSYERADSLFWKTIELKNFQFSEAELNLLRLYYNRGRAYFNAFQGKPDQLALLDSAGLYFQRGLSFPADLRQRSQAQGFARLEDTSRWDNQLEHLRHGLGLTYFFKNETASAEAIYLSIPGRYFDTLSYIPNLRTFIAEGDEISRLLTIRPREVEGNVTELIVNYYLQDTLSTAGAVIEAFVTGDTLERATLLPSTAVNGSASATSGLGLATIQLRPLEGYPEQADSILVQLRIGENPPLDRRWVAYAKDWIAPVRQKTRQATLRARDARTGDVLDNVQLILTEQTDRGQSRQIYSTYLHTDGRVDLPVTVPENTWYAFQREGYEPRRLSAREFAKLGRNIELQPAEDERLAKIRMDLAKGEFEASLRSAIEWLGDRDPKERARLEGLLREWRRVQGLANNQAITQQDVVATQEEIRQAIDRITGGGITERKISTGLRTLPGNETQRTTSTSSERVVGKERPDDVNIPLNPQTKEVKQSIPPSRLVGNGEPIRVTDFDGAKLGSMYILELNLYTTTYGTTAKLRAVVDLAARQINVRSYSHFASKSADDSVTGNGTDAITTESQAYSQFRLYFGKDGALYLEQVMNPGGSEAKLRLDASTWEPMTY